MDLNHSNFFRYKAGDVLVNNRQPGYEILIIKTQIITKPLGSFLYHYKFVKPLLGDMLQIEAVNLEETYSLKPIMFHTIWQAINE